jgi:hypothetical protein
MKKNPMIARTAIGRTMRSVRIACGANRHDSSPNAAITKIATASAATSTAPRSASFMRHRRRTCRMMPIRSSDGGS